MKIWLLIPLFYAFIASASESERFVKAYRISGDRCVVISEGDLESRAFGSYTIRLHDWTGDSLPAAGFYSGLVRPRDGVLENVFFIDLDGGGRKDVIVTIRCAGTGAYLSADAIVIRENSLVLIANVQGLPPKANVIRALRDQIRSQKKSKP